MSIRRLADKLAKTSTLLLSAVGQVTNGATKGTGVPDQYPAESKPESESRCRLCGGYQMLLWCANSSCRCHNKGFRGSGETDSCEECGEMLEFKSLTDPCPDCLNNPQRLELEALKGELNIPPDLAYYFTDDGEQYGERWKGYKVGYLGIKLGRFSNLIIPQEYVDAEDKMPYLVEEVRAKPWLLLPFFCLRVPDDPDQIVKVQRVTARYKDSPLYAEMRIPPIGGPITVIRGADYKHSQQDRVRALTALDLIGVIAKENSSPAGRPRALKGETLESLARTYAYLSVCRKNRNEKAPEQEDFRQAYGDVSRTTFYRYFKDKLSCSWPDVKREGKKIAESLTIDDVPKAIKDLYAIED